MEEIRCPKCNHKLGEMEGKLEGTLSYKCDKCKTIVVFDKRPTGVYSVH